MENNLYQKSYSFAIRVVELSKYLIVEKREYILSKQFLRSGTSIGANVAEANGAISKNDFSFKMYTAYKECLESKYWLSLLKDTGYISQDTFETLFADADELAKILYTIINKSRDRKYQ